MGIRPHPYRVRSDTHGLSHGLKIARPLSIFTPVCGLVSPYQVLRHTSEKSDSECCRTFLAGALGLEPRAYGFGDEADKSASGELLSKCYFQQSKNKSPPYSQNPIKNETNWEFQKQAYGLLGLRSILPKPSAQKLYHIPLILSIIRWLFLASFDSNYSQSL